MLDLFEEKNIYEKIKRARLLAHELLENPTHFMVPVEPARDVSVFAPGDLPGKKGFSSNEGQARLLHDLASIELQAMELCQRSLIEYPDAPAEFREQLLSIMLDEASHLELCLQGLEVLGYKWGDWPVHLALWFSVSGKDELLDRILIVHRYLEASGLDAGETLLRRLYGVTRGSVFQVVNKIVKDEIGHVLFGSRWYRNICELNMIDPSSDFVSRFNQIKFKVPKRIEPLSHRLRQWAGFTEGEINFIEEERSRMARIPLVKISMAEVLAEKNPPYLRELI